MTPGITVTAPGICHNLPLDGSPAAQQVSVDDGRPVGHVVLGYLAGQPVVLHLGDLQIVGALVHTLEVEGARMSQFITDEVRGTSA